MFDFAFLSTMMQNWNSLMDTSFDELKAITDAIYSENPQGDLHLQIVNILNNHGIRFRQDDGVNPEITISHPTTRQGTMVVGLRYTKNDGTKTEDHFLFQSDLPIEKHYGKKLEELFPEYKGTHKLQR